MAVVESIVSGRRYVALITTVSVAHLVSHIHIMTLPALIPLLPKHFGVGFVEIGVALTVFNVVTLLVQAPMGFLTDMLGARRLLVAALLLGGIAILSLAFTSDYLWLVVAMATAGLANGVYHPADYALLSAGIGARRLGRAFSIHTFAGYVGTAITPAALLSIAAFGGVRAAFGASGLFGVVAALVVLAGLTQPVRQRDDQFARGKSHGVRVAAIAPAVLSLTALFVLLNLSTSGIQNFSVSALVAGYGLELPLANTALTGFLFASAFGVLAGGALADRTTRHGYVAIVPFLLNAILIMVVAVVRLSTPILLLLLASAGFLSGVIAPSRDMLVRSAAPAGAEGRVFGIVSTGFNVGGVVGPILFGWMLDQGLPRWIFGGSVVFMILTVALTIYQERRVETHGKTPA
jgi:MFS transporter, FSR family, fosmidomycin resistance protein